MRRGHSRTAARCAAASSALPHRRRSDRSAPRASRRARRPSRSSCAASAVRARRGQLGILVRGTRSPAANSGAERDARLRGHRAQEPSGLLEQQPAAVAGLAVGGDRAAMRQAIERGNGGLHQPVTGADRRGSRSGRSRSCRARRRPYRVPVRVHGDGLDVIWNAAAPAPRGSRSRRLKGSPQFRR